ncbi:MAG: hypothetical protein ABIL62_16010, partial [Planctomycetota bacterium]
TKFVSMLHYKSLHFTRVDKLKDPYDSSVTSFFVDFIEIIESDIKKIKEDEKEQRKKLFVNCWHINASESAALWKVYMKSDEGIAIQTTVKKLITVLEASNNDLPFDLASVNYDPSKLASVATMPNGESILSLSTTKALFTKRSCFQYEKELRVIAGFDKPKSTGFNWGSLDINSLIESICVNPEASTWVVSLVRDLAKSYKIEGEVYKSKIY